MFMVRASKVYVVSIFRILICLNWAHSLGLYIINYVILDLSLLWGKRDVFSEGYGRYLALCLTSSVSQSVSQLVNQCVSVFWRRNVESYSVARLHLHCPSY